MIADGQATSATFAINSVDDALLDGSQVVTVTASATGFVSGSDTLDVTDFEQLSLNISADMVYEVGGATTATVSRTDTNGALTVTLLSGDIGEADVVPSVVIADGQTNSEPFAVSAVDDNLTDGPQTATISASASGYESAFDSIVVTDDESLVAFDLRLVRVPTPVSDDGEVAALPANAEMLDEWEGFVAEIYVSTPNSDALDIAAAIADLTYDTRYFTAMSVDFDGAFTVLQTAHIDDFIGRVTEISAGTFDRDVGDDGFALLARVSFQPVGNDNVFMQTDGEHVRPTSDLGFRLENTTALEVGIGEVLSESGPMPETMLRPVVSDLNDDGIIDFGDFSVFSGVFRESIDITSPSTAFAADFNFDNQVDFGDFSLLAANFRLTRESGGERVYSNDFPTGASALRAQFLSSSHSEDGLPSLTDAQLQPVAAEAVSRISNAVGDSTGADIRADLQTVTFEVSDLPGDLLGQMRANVIVIDADAADNGWFIGATPATDFEFDSAADSSELTATSTGPAADRADLLTVLMHELGHWLGREHSDQNGELMYDSLPLGVRRLPNLQSADYEFQTVDVDSMFAEYLDNAELLPI